jgi:CheY-like chemotaxis protein
MSPQPATVLVVDDERDTCANLKDILTDLDYDVDVAYDGPSALSLAEGADAVYYKPLDVPELIATVQRLTK